ncbi:recombinase family protein [Chryseobacterium sp. C-71]|uniref:RES family NAD+ phosphorylase n=1 Tax=Chryseobacterium sp. C-71 TaxID=2893882 RepID=UPI001E57B2AB|nr:recombinase family protein [Chryseobacterium sp. C-71]UFH31554.1 recombinase family protein [Chryseobacterium sp. C-71]
MNSAYLYVRVSTDEQKRKGYSLPEQEDRLLKYCKYNNIEVKGIYREDYSAKNFNRPEWKELFSEVKKKSTGEDKNILFIKWDGQQNPLLESLKSILDSSILKIQEKLKTENYFKYENDITNMLSEYAENCKIIIKKKSEFFRARVGYAHKKIDFQSLNVEVETVYEPYSGSDIGAPPPHLAGDGRINRVGVSYLYCATDKYTATAEIRPHPGDIVSIGKFIVNKDRFIKFDLKDKSNTDKLFDHSLKVLAMPNSTVHIIDKIYDSLKRFEELGFINPDYLASIKPFNILDEYVWHYHNYKLFTLNPEIYYLLQEIEFKDSDIFLSEKLKAEIREYHIIEAKEKLMWSFKFLNNSMITEIEAVKDYQLEIDKRKNSNTIGFSHKHVFWTDDSIATKANIDLRNEAEICDCIVCNYRNFEFEKLIKKLKVAEGNNDYNNLNYALGNFLVSRNDYKTSYNILKNIRDETKQQSKNGITYFLASLNTTFLYNHFNIYSLDDRDEIRNEITNFQIRC